MISRRRRYLLVAALLTGCGGSGGGDTGSGGGTSVPVTVIPEPQGPFVARQWNDLLLEAIRNDYARPTVHARNLFHVSAAMYDAWAVYSETATTYAALGNYIADCYIRFGLQDGSNEENNYANIGYMPVNPGIDPTEPGNPGIVDLNRWQSVALPIAIDQAGNLLEDGEPPFLGAEWGRVEPFALGETDLTVYARDGFDYYVYLDPGPPPFAGYVSGHSTFSRAAAKARRLLGASRLS